MSQIDKKWDFSSKMANIDLKYDSSIHFTIKFNSKDYSIYFLSGIFNSKNWFKNSNSALFIQLEITGIKHHYSKDSFWYLLQQLSISSNIWSIWQHPPLLLGRPSRLSACASTRGEQYIETIASLDQWSMTIENHWNQWLNDLKTIKKPLKPMVWGLKII